MTNHFFNLKSAVFLLIIFVLSFTFAEELVIEWAVPLKKNLTQLNKREQGGVVIFGKDLLVATRSGQLHLFSQKGEIKKTLMFDGDFYFIPQILDDGKVLVTVSNSVFLLDPSLNTIWSSSGKTPVASKPMVDKNNVLIQFQDNAIYVLDRTDGKIKSSYTYYSDEEVSFLRLSSPFILGDKYVFGFSSGMIVFFMLKDSGSVSEMIPYFKFKTTGSTRTLEKKEFFDILSILPVKDTIVFSGGEYGGIVVDGKIQKLENMKNLQLVKEKDGTITGFGEGGVFKFESEGKFISKSFSSTNYVSNYLKTEDYVVLSTTGEGSILGYDEGFVYLFSSDIKTKHHSIMIPNGVSSAMSGRNNSVFFISDMGVVYKFNIIK